MKSLFAPFALAATLLFAFSSCQRDENIATPSGGKVLIRTAVKIKVGDVLYENVDAKLTVAGYDANNVLEWSKDYSYVGPHDTLEVTAGFHHYSIALVNKWGISDLQSEISGNAIWDGRADGSAPVTYVMGGAAAAKKLSMVITSREEDPSTGLVYQPESRLSYDYDSQGRLQFIHHEVFNSATEQFEEESIDAFQYQGVTLSKITNTISGHPDTGYRYLYRINRIVEDMFVQNNSVWTLTAVLTYDTLANNKVMVDYNNTNGSSYSYEFNVSFKNNVNDKTGQGSQVCNLGQYTYDKNINPFRHLGYTDINFLNWSINNKLTEDVNYFACGFPTLIPVSYSYTYDQEGYPLKGVTSYQSNPHHSQQEFYYK